MMRFRTRTGTQASNDLREEAWLEERLSPLSQLEPSARLREQNRRRISTVLAEMEETSQQRQQVWWRRTIPLPIPLAAAALVLIGVLGTFNWVLFTGSSAVPTASVSPVPNLIQNPALPAISGAPVPQPVDTAGLELDHWYFDQSIVIHNDRPYLGKLSAHGGPLLRLDIPAVAHIELALQPFRQASPQGVLQEGHLTINDGDANTIEIHNVKNGKRPIILPDGPYQVWVRWSAPPLSPQEKNQDTRLPAMSYTIGNIPENDRLK